MKAGRHFSKTVVAALHASKILGIRAGRTHRFIGIWLVIVENRLFVRSWKRTRGGWYRTFLDDPRGAIQIAGRTIEVRAKPTRSERLRAAVDAAYAEKYPTPASLKYVRGFKLARRRDTTTELVPAGGQSTARDK